MARPVFAQELQDADFTWLLNTFRERRPDLLLLDTTGCSVVLLPVERSPMMLESGGGPNQQMLPQGIAAKPESEYQLRKR